MNGMLYMLYVYVVWGGQATDGGMGWNGMENLEWITYVGKSLLVYMTD